MRRANGTGSVYKLSGKRRRPWVASISCGLDSLGRPIRRIIGCFPRRADAESALALYHFDPSLTEKKDITLRQLYDEWSSVHYTNISQSMAAGYQAAWRFLEPFYHVKFRLIRTAHVQRTLDDISASKSQSTLQKVRTLWGLLFKYALENDIVTKNYAQFATLPKYEKVEKEIFPDTEIAIYQKHDENPAAQILLMLIYSGMRIQELLNLTVFDVDLKRRTITGGLKTDSGKHGVIPIASKVYPYWVNWCDGCTGYIFTRAGSRITQAYYRNSMLYPLQDELGLPRRTPHAARHTCATMLARQGIAPLLIQQILGHSNYAFTADVYTHKDMNSLQNAIDSL